MSCKYKKINNKKKKQIPVQTSAKKKPTAKGGHKCIRNAFHDSVAIFP